MSAPGWIKIHRALMDNWCSAEPEALAVWVRLLCEANFEDKKTMFNGCYIELKRGQLLFGLDAFSARSGVSVMKLRRIISLLEKDGMINRLASNRYSIISITCYDKYQDDNRPTTGQEQANDNPATAPKEVKESKKERSEEEEKKKKAAPVVAVDFSQMAMSQNQLDELKRIRAKNKGGAITQRVASALAVEFGIGRGIGYTNEEMLTEWEMRGWKSFKADWIKPKATNGALMPYGAHVQKTLDVLDNFNWDD
jgi:hypothetical protein